MGGLTGAAEGVVGIVAKPLAGALDGAVLLLRGLTATVSGLAGHTARARLPRYIGPPGTALAEYSSREAAGFARLWLLQVTFISMFCIGEGNPTAMRAD